MTKSGYFPSRTTMNVNIFQMVPSPAQIFERGTGKTIIGQYPKKLRRRVCTRVPKCILLPQALWAQLLDLEWEYIMCSTKYGYWRPLIDPPSHPILMSYGGISSNLCCWHCLQLSRCRRHFPPHVTIII